MAQTYLIKSFIELAPSEHEKACQNCKSFSKYGVVTGYCSKKKKDKLDYQKCKHFEFEPNKKDEL